MSDKLTVYYDGACPLCRREIGFYRRRRGADAVRWVDVSEAGDCVAPDLAKTDALARFHVRTHDGALVHGGAAFARLWAALPGFRVLGSLFRAPPLAWALDRAYNLFLPLRPSLQALIADRRTRARRTR